VIKWSGRTPRAWQRNALPVCLNALREGVRGVVHAVMGSGKSLLLAEVIAQQPSDARILVTTPTIALVEQLHATISQRLGEPVGRVYTLRSDVQRVTVACVPSARRLLDRVPDWDLWIADEAHRTECDSLTALDLPAARLGMSATPYTGDGRGSLSLFEREIVRYDADDAIRDRVIVPPRVYPYTGGAEIPDDATGDVALDLVCRHMLKRHNPEGPGIVNASSNIEVNSSRCYT